VPVALWVGIGVIVLAIAGYVAWRFLRGGDGYVELTAAPWAEIVGVQTKDGKTLDVKGQTPVRLELPPGEYVIELKKDQAVGNVNVVVKSGEITQGKYVFPEVNVDAMVDELVSKY
jgi:hypothetical protein